MIHIIPPQRTTDKHGSGFFGAPRGTRTHRGIDVACWPGSLVQSICDGTVTKHGWPYSDPNKSEYRYIEVTDDEGLKFRYFYVLPAITEGNRVKAGDILGEVQDLGKIYKGITPHFHFEVKLNGQYLNPNQFLQRSEI